MDQGWNDESVGRFREKTGRGAFEYVLGQGASGSFGHVEVLLRTVPTPGRHLVEWDVSNCELPEDAHERIVAAADSYIKQYVNAFTGHGIHVTIIQARSDKTRRNDYERATNVAIRFALEDAGLPTPQIFAP